MSIHRACTILPACAVATLAAVAQERPVISSTPDSTPFYQSVADEASLERVVEARLVRAKQLLQDLLTVSGKRTPENTLRLYDGLLIEQANAERQMDIVGQLHPDARMRAAAGRHLQRLHAFGSGVSLNPGVFDALAAIDLAGASAEVKYYVDGELADYRREGVNRDEAANARLRQLRAQLFAAEQEFGGNIRDGVRRFHVEAGRTWLGRINSREHDFFETSSQLLEEWVTNPLVLAIFARHHETGEPIPHSLIQKLQRSERFVRGAQVRGEAVRAKFSLSLHDRNPDSVEPNKMYRDIFQTHVPTPFHEGRYFAAGFQQLRNAGGATLYRYLWAEVIVKDLFSRFDRVNLLDPTIARRYKETVLAPGTSKPGAQLVQDFLGRPFNVNAWEKWLNEDPASR